MKKGPPILWSFLLDIEPRFSYVQPNPKRVLIIHPVRNDAPLLCPVPHAVQGSAAGLGPRIIPAGFDAPLGFES